MHIFVCVCAPVMSLRHRQHTERHMHALYYLFQVYIQTDLTERGTWNEEQPWFRAAGSQVHPFCIIRQRPASCCEVILPWKWIKSAVLWLFSQISGICGGIALRFHLQHPPPGLFSDQNQIKPKQFNETYMDRQKDTICFDTVMLFAITLGEKTPSPFTI